MHINIDTDNLLTQVMILLIIPSIIVLVPPPYDFDFNYSN